MTGTRYFVSKNGLHNDYASFEKRIFLHMNDYVANSVKRFAYNVQT